MSEPQVQNTAINVSSRFTTVHGLAVVGFITLIGAGMWLAVYSNRFVPSVVGRFSSAAVYLGALVSPSPKPLASTSTLTPPQTISFGDFGALAPVNQSDASTTVKEPDPPAPTTVRPVQPVAGERTSSVIQLGATTTTIAQANGLPDFVVTIDSIGYLPAPSADSFVASSSVPAGSRPAVKFTVKNAGSGTSGSWRFSASIPTQTAYIYQSQPQQPLAPGDSIAYVLGFDQAKKGEGQTISISANIDNAAAESIPDNNSASVKITVL
jgi:CARDB